MTLPPLTVEKILALVTAVACIVMLVRLALKPAQRARLDGAAWRVWFKLRNGAQGLWAWRQRRVAREQARRTAQAVIERARQGDAPTVKRDGNVLTPDSFQRPRKPH
ncbi:MAG: hypothetical protein RI907_41 [Pseudomonadota bacterium]